MSTWVCIASGPSLTQADVDYVRGKARVAVVNDNWRLAPWADLHYAADGRWWDRYWPEVEAETECERWTQCEPAAEKYGLNRAISRHPVGLSDNLGVLYLGQMPERKLVFSDSGFQMIQLVYQKGARRILLLGYDLQYTGGRRHWFGDHPDDFNNAHAIEHWRAKYEPLAQLLEAVGVELINCTRQTALTSVPRRDLRAVL